MASKPQYLVTAHWHDKTKTLHVEPNKRAADKIATRLRDVASVDRVTVERLTVSGAEAT